MFIQYKSPNFDDRPADAAVDMLVLHYTGMQNCDVALKQLCNPDAKVSCHYLIDESGEIFQLVAEEKRAWHAGVSSWRGRAHVNNYSIGIELVNPGHEYGYRDFPELQMQSLITLCKEILGRHKIPAHNVVGHSDIAPLRKEDPGEFFNWEMLANDGIGLWSEVDGISEEILLCKEAQGDDVSHMQKTLAEYGYGIEVDGYYGVHTEKTVIAFQRHFCQKYVDGIWHLCNKSSINQLVNAAS